MPQILTPAGGGRPSRRPRRGVVLAGGLAAALSVGAVVAVILVVALGSSGSGHRHGLMESLFQDDQLLVDSPAPTVSRTLDTLRSLGVDRVRITVLWASIAPGAKPAGFRAADPAAYPATAWVPYDRVVTLARARGIDVDFNVTAPGPLWAMQHAPNPKYATHYSPSADAFGHFVAAVGKRYSGSYQPPGATTKLPRVSYWTVWNEPNQPGWLAPQFRTVSGRPVVNAPRLYRSLVDSAFAGLRATGHTTSTDTILVGELAPEGTEATKTETPIPPLPFLRAMYCVDQSEKPLTGAAATALGCPSNGGTGAFVKAHPALFDPTGFAHHPYSFFLKPSAGFSDPNFVPLSQLTRLETALDSIFSAYGVHRQLPIYLTEYGYETNPPDPFRGVPLAKQALYLDQAQYMAWQDSRVRSMAQFLLVDSAPNTTFPKNSVGYWSTFQTGLEFLGGKRKPSFVAYRLPIYVPKPFFARGATVSVWGMLRPAKNGTEQQAQIQYRPRHGAAQTLATVDTHDASGFLSTNVAPPGSGSLRILWTAPDGKVLRSRAATITQTG
ncbi:MAG TPA: hypothetical protein VGI87_04655 [Solirubrobacteraceae bacterium]|jgi:hypothetical protein